MSVSSTPWPPGCSPTCRGTRRCRPPPQPRQHRAERAVRGLPAPRGVHRQPAADLDAEAAHRGHAIIEQVIADLKNSAIAHLPSGAFAENGAWLVCAAIAFNLTRGA